MNILQRQARELNLPLDSLKLKAEPVPSPPLRSHGLTVSGLWLEVRTPSLIMMIHSSLLTSPLLSGRKMVNEGLCPSGGGGEDHHLPFSSLLSVCRSSHRGRSLLDPQRDGGDGLGGELYLLLSSLSNSRERKRRRRQRCSRRRIRGMKTCQLYITDHVTHLTPCPCYLRSLCVRAVSLTGSDEASHWCSNLHARKMNRDLKLCVDVMKRER